MQTNTSQGVIAWFVRNTVAANLLMLLILVAGISTLLNIRIEGFPQIPPNNVTIKVGYTSGSATSAEEGIAVKIEEALQGVEGIKTIQSLSDGEGVTVTVTRTSGYNLDLLYRDIKAKVDAISSLPKLAERPVISQEVALEGVMTINLFGDVATTFCSHTPKIFVQSCFKILTSSGLTISAGKHRRSPLKSMKPTFRRLACQ